MVISTTTPNRRRSTAFGLDLNLEAAAAARWRKMKSQRSQKVILNPKSPHD
jgi:hypothetical protein